MNDVLDNLSGTLSNIGITEDGANAYLQCLQNANGMDISTLTSLFEKGAAEKNINQLVQQDFLFIENDRYYACNPERMITKIKNTFMGLQHILPFLLGANSSFDNSFKISTYFGKEGIKSIHEDILATLSPLPAEKKLFYQMSSSRYLFEIIPEHQEHFVDKRIEAEILLYWMAPKKDCYWPHAYKPDQNFRFARMFDVDEFPFHIELDVYGNKVAIISLHDGRVNGVVIEDNLVAESMLSVCEFLWKNLSIIDKGK